MELIKRCIFKLDAEIFYYCRVHYSVLSFFLQCKERCNDGFIMSTTYQDDSPECESYDDLFVQFAVEEENLSSLEK